MNGNDNDNDNDLRLPTKVAVLKEQVFSLRREISTQAVEYLRRLGDLQQAHEKQMSVILRIIAIVVPAMLTIVVLLWKR